MLKFTELATSKLLHSKIRKVIDEKHFNLLNALSVLFSSFVVIGHVLAHRERPINYPFGQIIVTPICCQQRKTRLFKRDQFGDAFFLIPVNA